VEKSWSFHIGPVYFDGAVLVMTVLTCAIIFGIVLGKSSDDFTTKGKQNVLEAIIDFVNGISKDNMGATITSLLTFRFCPLHVHLCCQLILA
jgi:F-type H+-transporting ATPase subunit a